MLAAPNESKLLLDVLLGNLKEQDMWDQFAKDLHINPELMSKIRRSLVSKRRLNRQLANFLGNLRNQYKTAILSNAGSEARRLFVDFFQFHLITDEMVISAEEGVVKPDQRIYEITVDRLSVQPQEVIFVDDFLENIEAARHFGMTAIHYKTNEQVIKEVGCLLAADR